MCTSDIYRDKNCKQKNKTKLYEMLEVHVKQVTVYMTEPRSIIKILNVEKRDHVEKMWLAKLKEIAVGKHYSVVWSNLILIS